MNNISSVSIENAHKRIKDYISLTPVLTSRALDEITGANLYFKCENFQRVGAFKFRGATNAVIKLTNTKQIEAVATHSSGNHAQALALAAQQQGLNAHIVMPNNSPKVKIQAVMGYGAQITFCEPNLEARESTLAEVVKRTNAVFIHPYDDNNIIEGQGTACLELIDSVPNLDAIVAPVGGGGLLSGTAVYAKSIGLKVYGAEPSGADDAKKSFDSKKLVPSVSPNTICDGLLTSLGKLNYSYILQYVDDILLADDEEIINSMRLIYERMKIIVEPSSAVTLAAIMNNKQLFSGMKIGIIISGGNVDMDSFFSSYINKSD